MMPKTLPKTHGNWQRQPDVLISAELRQALAGSDMFDYILASNRARLGDPAPLICLSKLKYSTAASYV